MLRFVLRPFTKICFYKFKPLRFRGFQVFRKSKEDKKLNMKFVLISKYLETLEHQGFIFLFLVVCILLEFLNTWTWKPRNLSPSLKPRNLSPSLVEAIFPFTD